MFYFFYHSFYCLLLSTFFDFSYLNYMPPGLLCPGGMDIEYQVVFYVRRCPCRGAIKVSQVSDGGFFLQETLM